CRSRRGAGLTRMRAAPSSCQPTREAPSMKKSLAVLGALAAAAIALSGCTDSAVGPTTSPTGDADSGELTKVRVAALPIAESGALWAAIDQGIFTDHGLDIEVVPA